MSMITMLERSQAWWQQRAPRERAALILLGAVGLVLALWALQQQAQKQVLALQRSQAQAHKVQFLAQQLQALGGAAPRLNGDDVPALVRQQAQMLGLAAALHSVQPEAGRIKVQWSRLAWADALRWMQAMQQAGLRIEAADWRSDGPQGVQGEVRLAP